MPKKENTKMGTDPYKKTDPTIGGIRVKMRTLKIVKILGLAYLVTSSFLLSNQQAMAKLISVKINAKIDLDLDGKIETISTKQFWTPYGQKISLVIISRGKKDLYLSPNLPVGCSGLKIADVLPTPGKEVLIYRPLWLFDDGSENLSDLRCEGKMRFTISVINNTDIEFMEVGKIITINTYSKNQGDLVLKETTQRITKALNFINLIPNHLKLGLDSFLSLYDQEKLELETAKNAFKTASLDMVTDLIKLPQEMSLQSRLDKNNEGKLYHVIRLNFFRENAGMVIDLIEQPTIKLLHLLYAPDNEED